MAIGYPPPEYPPPSQILLIVKTAVPAKGYIRSFDEIASDIHDAIASTLKCEGSEYIEDKTPEVRTLYTDKDKALSIYYYLRKDDKVTCIRSKGKPDLMWKISFRFFYMIVVEGKRYITYPEGIVVSQVVER